VLGSSLVRESHGVIYTHAGPEIGVASTKAYTAQLATFYLFALYLAGLRRAMHRQAIARSLDSLRHCVKLQEKVLKRQSLIKNLAFRHSHQLVLVSQEEHQLPVGPRRALKLKISYAPPGMRRRETCRPIALIDEYRAVVCMPPLNNIRKMASNIRRCSQRGR
jgi:glucosamine--fructose-6-phosphate aminotransferase (isomerizing)